MDEDENSKKRSDEIKKIHHQFLSKKALSLKRARQEAPSFRMPPEYNQTITAERKISDKKYEIDVLDDSGEKKTYTLVLEGGEWKIDQMGFMYYDKWKKSRQLF
ncbi:NTF2 fold immunity protein [Neisseria sicca]|uniref:NTF2 fold immunity protein n=1 Tax=Neisseria sicca TaxID=490 RepID=UPI0032046A8C